MNLEIFMIVKQNIRTIFQQIFTEQRNKMLSNRNFRLAEIFNNFVRSS